jgi:putative peptide zinc metalloprotease protein
MSPVMADNRTTPWQVIAPLMPRLRHSIQIRRQLFRGEPWYVIQDATRNRFFRLEKVAYRFITRLDGMLTVADALQATQAEVGGSGFDRHQALRLLQNLFASDLLQVELPAPAQAILKPPSTGVLGNSLGFLRLFFIRLQLLDPDRILERLTPLFGSLYSLAGGIVWGMVMLAGLLTAAGHSNQLIAEVGGLFDEPNLLLLYCAFVVLKLAHEFGHAFACKTMCHGEGFRGEIHAMGIMLMAFIPIPYVDVTASWGLSSRWRRMLVGMGGMLVELLVAALATLVWSQSASNTTLHLFCLNLMFIGAATTLIFNANPLLRYDGYYILSDLLEIPNLDQRARRQVHHLLKRSLLLVRPPSPPFFAGERRWLISYGIAAALYRPVVFVLILMFVAERFMVLGPILAIGGMVEWLLRPIGRLYRYLRSSRELTGVRLRATLQVLVFITALLSAGLWVSLPDWVVLEGVVESQTPTPVYMKSSGRIRTILSTGSRVSPDGSPLVVVDNHALKAKKAQLLAESRISTLKRNQALATDDSSLQILDDRLQLLGERLERVQEDIDNLTIRASNSGIWVAAQLDGLMTGMYLDRGGDLGRIVNLSQLRIRVDTPQEEAARIIATGGSRVTVRLQEQPDLEWSGRILGPISVKPDGEAQDFNSRQGSFPVTGILAQQQDDGVAKHSSGAGIIGQGFELFVS